MLDGQLIFLLLMLGLLFFMFSRTRKQQRAQTELINSVAPGAEIMTTSGMYGRVVSVEDDVMVLEVAPGTRTRWNRRAVARVLAPAATSGEALGAAAPDAGIDLSKGGRVQPSAGADEDRPRP